MKQSRKKKAGHRTWAARNAPVPGEHTGDIMSPEKRSAVMSRIRGKDTKPERMLAEGLRSHGLEFKQNEKDLPGRPDVVFRGLKLAVFVDGDFWHGWRFPLWQHKLTPKWRDKIAATRLRDGRNFRRLRRDGWRVIRLWEHQIEQSLERCVAKVVQAAEARRAEGCPPVITPSDPPKSGSGA